MPDFSIIPGSASFSLPSQLWNECTAVDLYCKPGKNFASREEFFVVAMRNFFGLVSCVGCGQLLFQISKLSFNNKEIPTELLLLFF